MIQCFSFFEFIKRECVFPMVICPAFRRGQYRVNDHPYHAPQFINYYENDSMLFFFWNNPFNFKLSMMEPLKESNSLLTIVFKMIPKFLVPKFLITLSLLDFPSVFFKTHSRFTNKMSKNYIKFLIYCTS